MLRPILYVLLVIVAIAAAAGIFFVTYGRARTWEMVAGKADLGPFDRTAPVRSPHPNDALLCTPGLCDGVEVDAALPAFPVAPETLIARVDAAMKSISPDAERVDDGSDPARARYVTRTPTMGFPDTNSFEAVAMDSGETGLVAYARAKLGRSDLGNNRKRLEAIATKLGD